jgi:hypothetical protein
MSLVLVNEAAVKANGSAVMVNRTAVKTKLSSVFVNMFSVNKKLSKVDKDEVVVLLKSFFYPPNPPLKKGRALLCSLILKKIQIKILVFLQITRQFAPLLVCKEGPGVDNRVLRASPELLPTQSSLEKREGFASLLDFEENLIEILHKLIR